MSPALEDFETVDTSRGLTEIARHLVSILKADPRTGFKREEAARQQVTAFWRDVESYVRLELGVLPANPLALIDRLSGGRGWIDPVEHHTGIDGAWVRFTRGTLDFLDDEEAVAAIVHTLKGASGWAPPTPGIESVIRKLRASESDGGLSQTDANSGANFEHEQVDGGLPEAGTVGVGASAPEAPHRLQFGCSCRRRSATCTPSVTSSPGSPFRS